MDKTLQQQKDELLAHYEFFKKTFPNLAKGALKTMERAYSEKLVAIDMAIKGIIPVAPKAKEASVET